jgi:hypothetical protein
MVIFSIRACFSQLLARVVVFATVAGAVSLVAGCASNPQRPVESDEPPKIHSATTSPSLSYSGGGFTLNASGTASIKLPASPALAGFPTTMQASFESRSESRVISTYPLRSQSTGQITIEISDPTSDSLHLKFESAIDETRDGPPQNSFDTLGKLFQQVQQLIQTAERATTRPSSQPAP